MNAEFWSENLKESDPFLDLGIDGVILKGNLEKYVFRVLTGFMWFRIQTGSWVF
jgi:hypothetical protein